MPPKLKPAEKEKAGKGKSKQPAKKKRSIDEAQVAAEKARYEKWLAERMSELACLRLSVEKADDENRTLRNQLRQLKRDREDVIAFVRRRLGNKCEEAAELELTNEELVKEKTTEKEVFLKEMKSKERHYNEMCENMTMHIKTLIGRLSNLEEYRDQRDFLLDKNNKLESYMTTMEARALAIEKEYEKANLTNKERMRREMEEKLSKFGVDFQRATKARIAANTRSVIKENIDLNNELSLLITSWQKLYDENESLHDKNRYLSTEVSTDRELREKLMSKNVTQAEVIDRLAMEHINVKEFHNGTGQLRKIIKKLKVQIIEDNKAMTEAAERIQITNEEIQRLELVVNSSLEGQRELRTIHDRNQTLVVKVCFELEAFEEMRETPANTEQNMYEQLFNRLDVMFEEDWLLDASAGDVGSLSVATVLGELLDERPVLGPRGDENEKCLTVAG